METQKMTWQDPHTLHIFLPDTETINPNWVEQVLGNVVLPVVKKFDEHIRWLWITRYSDQYDANSPPQETILPQEFCASGSYCFVAFRLCARDEVKSEVHQMALSLVKQYGYYATEWVERKIISDLGSDRFAPSDADSNFRLARAELVAEFVNSTVRLMLHSLINDASGKWHLENNQSGYNPHGSIFESLHHLFCNATGVPTDVLIDASVNVESGMIGTYWNQPQSSQEPKIIPVRY